ncbi:MAG: hypothetical protein MZV70_70740 [Desulfobacterales bacterium]|nr:hypothetical protein [Desulfobacterales bacterium]
MVIDASDLPQRDHGPSGAAASASRARVMAVYGNLTMSNVTIAVGLFPGGGHRRRDPALHAGPGRRPGGLGHGPAPQLRRHRQHLRRRYRRQPRPRHLRRRHLFQRARPRGHRRQRQPGPRRRGRRAAASIPSAGPTTPTAGATTPPWCAARSAATG